MISSSEHSVLVKQKYLLRRLEDSAFTPHVYMYNLKYLQLSNDVAQSGLWPSLIFHHLHFLEQPYRKVFVLM